MARTSHAARIPLGPGSWVAGQWSAEAEPGEFAAVFIHGFGSVRYGEKAAALEASCAKRGWTFAAFDFRGHGESSGTMRELRGSGLLADLEAVADFLRQRGIRRLGLVGSSMGAWAAAWFALRNPELVAALALIAPGFHFLTARWDRLDDAGREAWKRTGVLRIQLEGVDTEIGYGLAEEAPLFPRERLLQELRTPTLIFQGMKDEIVPASRIIAWVEQAANPNVELRLYKNGDHRLVDRKQEMAEAACEFFARHLGLSIRPLARAR